jgi:hypothetical protein
MESVHFKAPWDFGLKAVAALVVLGIAVFVALASVSGSFHGVPRAILYFPFFTVPLLVLFAAFLGAPRGYTVDGTRIRVERMGGPVSIPLSSVSEVRAYGPLGSLQRVERPGEIFGYWGDYQSAELGTVRALATRTTDCVLLRTTGGAYLITPSSPEEFVTLVSERLGRRG